MVNSLQIVVISFGIILAAVILNLCFPVLIEFMVSDVPVIWNSITSWFKPIYLYLLINCIIVTLIASSKFQQNHEQDAVDNLPLLLLSQSTNDISPDDADDVGAVEIDPSVEVADVVVKKFPADSVSMDGIDGDIIEGTHMEMIAIDYKEDGDGDGDGDGDDEKKILLDDLEMDAYVAEGAGKMELKEIAADSAPVLSLQHWNLGERSVWDEKPPRSNRLSHRSKPIKSNTNGGRGSNSLRVVSKSKRYETLESTWKAITEGRGMPLTRHKRKSETWENEDRRNLGTEQQDNSETPYNLKKEEEEESNSSRTRRNMKLKREASPGQDELHRKVEAFIKKFNEEMRLQRQRSLQQYKDMMMRINGGNTT